MIQRIIFELKLYLDKVDRRTILHWYFWGFVATIICSLLSLNSKEHWVGWVMYPPVSTGEYMTMLPTNQTVILTLLMSFVPWVVILVGLFVVSRSKRFTGAQFSPITWVLCVLASIFVFITNPFARPSNEFYISDIMITNPDKVKTEAIYEPITFNEPDTFILLTLGNDGVVFGLYCGIFAIIIFIIEVVRQYYRRTYSS